MDASSTGKSWNIDWTKCCLCQEVKREDLKSPQANPARRGDDGYMNLATNIPLFHSLNALPMKLDPARLDEGGGIDETLRQKKARYHESCRLIFNNTKLHRAEQDQPLQVLVMRAVEVRSHERSKKLKHKNVSFAKPKGGSLEKQ